MTATVAVIIDYQIFTSPLMTVLHHLAPLNMRLSFTPFFSLNK